MLSQQALIAVSGKTPYMGNTTAIPYEDGKLIPRFAMTEEEIDKLMAGDPTNLYFMQALRLRAHASRPEGPGALRHPPLRSGKSVRRHAQIRL